MTRPLRKHPEVLAQHLPQQGRRILDVGCGDGALVRLLARNGAEATGLEPQADLAAAALQARRSPSEHFVCGLGEALPFAAGSFDAVVFFNALHHVPAAAMGPALREALRVLAPGGLLYVQEPLAEGAYFQLMRPVEDETEVRRQAIEALAALEREGRAEPVALEVYEAPIVYRDYADWEARMSRVDPERGPRVAALRESLQEGFAAAAETVAEGFRFRMPSRLNLYRVPA